MGVFECNGILGEGMLFDDDDIIDIELFELSWELFELSWDLISVLLVFDFWVMFLEIWLERIFLVNVLFDELVVVLLFVWLVFVCLLCFGVLIIFFFWGLSGRLMMRFLRIWYRVVVVLDLVYDFLSMWRFLLIVLSIVLCCGRVWVLLWIKVEYMIVVVLKM